MTSQAWTEEPLRLPCAGESLLAVLSLPAQGKPRGGVVIVVGGPQYRAGSHRQFVLLARRLASGGYAVLRFDARGMGDSTGAVASFDELDADVDAAVQALRARCPGLPGVALWGLCDGASAVMIYAQGRASSSVQALAVANPWVRSGETHARAHVRHYYPDRLLQPSFWVKLISGGVARRAAADFAHNVWHALRKGQRRERMGFQQRMAAGWFNFKGPILLLMSENDYTAREFDDVTASAPEWRGAMQRPMLDRVDLAGADHTFSDAVARRAVEEATLSWLAHALGSQEPAAAASS